LCVILSEQPKDAFRQQDFGRIESSEEIAMEYSAVGASNRRARFVIERTICRAFRTAHLLTADVHQAEIAVLKAIDLFEPEVDTEETLFRHTMHAAVLTPTEPMPRAASHRSEPTEPMPRAASHRSEPTDSFVPVELQAVLNLSRDLRYCFVLRVLAGWSQLACARLLGLQGRSVDRYTWAALQCLAGFEPNFHGQPFF